MSRDPLGDAVRAQRAARLAAAQKVPVLNDQLQQAGGIDPGMITEPFFQIHITHIPTGKDVTFDGWVTEFSDTYTQRWNETQVYGRMDPLSTFQGTGRQISLGFDIVNDSLAMAESNMAMIARFLKFQYPVYQDHRLNQANVLKGAPLMAFKWTNLISSPNNKDQKLVGYINGSVSYAPDMSEGGFLVDQIIEHATNPQRNKKAIRNYIPKKVSLNFSFTVLHTHLPGWSNPSISQLSDQHGDNFKKMSAKGKQLVRKVSYTFGGNSTNNDRFPNIYTDPPVPEQVVAQQQQTAEGLQQADREFEDSTGLEELVPASPEAAARREAINKHIKDRKAALKKQEEARARQCLGKNVEGHDPNPDKTKL